MEVRRRRIAPNNTEQQRPLEVLQNLDVFTKLPEECEKSTSGGGIDTSLDVYDNTGLSMKSKGQVHYRDTVYELDETQRRHFEVRLLNL
ncbi:unnamed protein product [Echinostoma caproni]|uniref:Cadherin domain-containing protein n=1 Tax=Echinostoma caproni TaxID=27848 RepID=A0A183A1F8_9TREM|nr:unnamed protein product [Echinostoma caproni]